MNYWLLLYPLFIALLLITYNLGQKKYENFYTFSLITVVICIIGFRSLDAGNDTEGYVYLFKKLNSFEDLISGYMSWKGDYFFTLLTLVIKKISDNPRFYLVSICLISILFLITGLRILLKRNKNRFLIICLFFSTPIPFLLFGNVIRQGLAIALITFGLGHYKIRPKIFYFFLLLSILSHKSAIIFLLFPIFDLIKGRYRYLKVFIYSLIGKSSIFLLILFIPFLRGKLLYYQNNFLEAENPIQIIITTLFVVILLNRNIYSLDIEKDLVYNYFFFVASISFVFLGIPKISGRLFLWVSPFLPYIVLNSLKNYKQFKELKYLMVILIIFGSFWAMLSNQIQLNIQFNS